MIYYIPPGLFVSVFICVQAIESVNICKLNGLQIGLIPASGVFMSYFMAAVTYVHTSVALSLTIPLLNRPPPPRLFWLPSPAL